MCLVVKSSLYMLEFNFYDYCGNCGKDLTKINDTEYACRHCGIKTFNPPQSAAGVLVFDEDRVLLSIRGIEPNKGMMDTLGGFLLFGEDPKTGAQREFNEETGAEVTNLRLVDVLAGAYTPNVTLIYPLYLADIVGSPELQPKDDVAELRWVPVGRLDRSLFGDPKQIAAIQKAYEMQKR